MLKQSYPSEKFCISKLDCDKVSKHTPKVDFSKMKRRTSNLFSINMENKRDYYHTNVDYVMQKQNICVISYDRQNSTEDDVSKCSLLNIIINLEKLAPDTDYDKVMAGMKKLGHIKSTNLGPIFDRQGPKEVTPGYKAHRKMRSLCSAMNKII